MAVRPHATGPGGEGALTVRFHRARTLTVSAIIAAATLLASVATVLAESGAGPIPR